MNGITRQIGHFATIQNNDLPAPRPLRRQARYTGPEGLHYNVRRDPVLRGYRDEMDRVGQAAFTAVVDGHTRSERAADNMDDRRNLHRDIRIVVGAVERQQRRRECQEVNSIAMRHLQRGDIAQHIRRFF